MTIRLNQTAFEQALKLVEDTQFRLNTVWATNRPSPEAEDRYIAANGWDAYANWYLAVNTDAPQDSKAHYLYPYGDFKSVHDTGVRQIKQRAQEAEQVEVADAAEEILDLLARFNAC